MSEDLWFRKKLCVEMLSIWSSSQMWHNRMSAWRSLAELTSATGGGKIDAVKIRDNEYELYEQIGAICKFIEQVTVLLQSHLIDQTLAKRLFWHDFKDWLGQFDNMSFPTPTQDWYDASVRPARGLFEEIK